MEMDHVAREIIDQMPASGRDQVLLPAVVDGEQLQLRASRAGADSENLENAPVLGVAAGDGDPDHALEPVDRIGGCRLGMRGKHVAGEGDPVMVCLLRIRSDVGRFPEAAQTPADEVVVRAGEAFSPGRPARIVAQAHDPGERIARAPARRGRHVLDRHEQLAGSDVERCVRDDQAPGPQGAGGRRSSHREGRIVAAAPGRPGDVLDDQAAASDRQHPADEIGLGGGRKHRLHRLLGAGIGVRAGLDSNQSRVGGRQDRGDGADHVARGQATVEDLDLMGELVIGFLGESVVEAEAHQHRVLAGLDQGVEHRLLVGRGQHQG